ncbi:MAG: L-arabinose isomerase [Christensenellales bacterium]
MKFWFIVGSQHLYGPEVLKEVAEHAEIMADGFNADDCIPFEVISKGVVTTPEEIKKVLIEANGDSQCVGVITWMHTFSPSKMWIGGLSLLNKPYLHINTQFNKSIPFDTIDMNFMNTNQSAHGDREHGFITARLRMKRKVICGYWEDKTFRSRMGGWMRSAAGAMASRNLKVLRLGDNMRYVAVTEGDKVQAEKDLGWSVNTYGVGGFAEMAANVTDNEINRKINEYKNNYVLNTDDLDSVEYQARLEIALEKMLVEGGFGAFTDTFEDLYKLKQLPGLATQNLMSKGYGFGAEGDWKTAALGAVMKEMSQGLSKGLSFIEDYTYHFEEGNEAVLGAHMLEISPAIASGKAKIEVHPLGIGGKDAPARLVFEGKEGDAILVTIIDMGGRFRMITHDIKAITPIKNMPNLPVASVMWKLKPDMITGNEAWILCGGTHHSVISFDLNAGHMRDFAEIMGMEFVHIGAHTNIPELREKLAMGDILWGR